MSQWDKIVYLSTKKYQVQLENSCWVVWFFFKEEMKEGLEGYPVVRIFWFV